MPTLPSYIHEYWLGLAAYPSAGTVKQEPAANHREPCSQRLHHRRVVSEDDPTRVELLQPLDPRSKRRESLVDSFPLRLGSAQLGWSVFDC
jgi:hypothetical protein